MVVFRFHFLERYEDETFLTLMNDPPVFLYVHIRMIVVYKAFWEIEILFLGSSFQERHQN